MNAFAIAAFLGFLVAIVYSESGPAAGLGVAVFSIVLVVIWVGILIEREIKKIKKN